MKGHCIPEMCALRNTGELHKIIQEVSPTIHSSILELLTNLPSVFVVKEWVWLPSNL